MNQLPPRYLAHPNSVPQFLFSLFTLAIVLVALPLGVYLVGQRTNVLPQAAPANVERQGTVSFTLEKDDQFATTSAQVAINLLARSDGQEANLFATRVIFPNRNLELVKVATSSAQLQNINQKTIVNKWVEAKIENAVGQADFIAGISGPGIRTNPDQQYIMAKLIFNVKSGGIAVLHLDPDSTIFTRADNRPLAARKNDLTLDLPPVSPPSPSPVAKKTAVLKQEVPSLELISPQGGETIPYTNPSTINWRQQGISEVSVNLLINGEKLGRIASVSAVLGKLDFRPADFLLPAFLAPDNTFQINIDGLTAKGEMLSDTSEGPFAIINQGTDLVATQAANLASRGGDANKDGQVDLTDLSILLSSFGQTQNVDLGIDLNGDGVVNDVDLWLFKGVLLR